MTKVEIETFIERMEEIGDVWDEADVERVYGDRSLEDALIDRMVHKDQYLDFLSVSVKEPTSGHVSRQNGPVSAKRPTGRGNGRN